MHISFLLAAIKALKYYKKSINISLLVDAKDASFEIQNDITIMIEILKLSNKNISKGKNIAKILSEYGFRLTTSLNKITNLLPSSDVEEISSILSDETFNCKIYINSFIDGTILQNNEFCSDEKFKVCQTRFEQIQTLIKKKIEDKADKLK